MEGQHSLSPVPPWHHHQYQHPNPFGPLQIEEEEELVMEYPKEEEEPASVGVVRSRPSGRKKESSLLRLDGLVAGHVAQMLIDGGASDNFIAASWIAKVGCRSSLILLPKPVTVTMPDGQSFSSTHQLVNVVIKLGQYSGTATFLQLDMKAPEVIIGMPWLKENNPYINWTSGTVISSDGAIIRQGRQSEAADGKLQVGHVQSRPDPSKPQSAAVPNSPPSTTLLPPEEHIDSDSERAPPGYVLVIGELNQKHRHYKGSNMAAVIMEFRDVFPDDLPPGLPPKRSIEHHILVYPNSTPIAKKQYRVPLHYLDEWKKQIQQLLAAGKITPSTSPYSAPILFVPKHNGKIRMCLDLRGLNDVTIKDKTALPNIHELFDRLQGSRYFSKMDLRSGFNQIRVAEEDVHKTAFNTPWGHFEWPVMPFGLTNAPATFQALMQDILRERLYNGVIVFIDDILMYSKDEKSHLELVRWVLEKLRAAQLYASPEKCEFLRHEIDILGHVINEHGIRTQPAKIDAILSWPIPQNKKQLRSFLGTCQFYHRFVKDFSAIASPLHSLTSKTTAWAWGKHQQRAFESLKQALTTAPTLILPRTDLPFTISTDASGFAIGAVLSQDHGDGPQPVCYLSQKMSPSEMNYATHEQELLAVIRALTEWRYYLLGSPHRCTVVTDHHSLTYLPTQPHLSKRQTHWLSILNDYNPIFVYRPGNTNVVADALSRRPDHEPSPSTTNSDSSSVVHEQRLPHTSSTMTPPSAIPHQHLPQQNQQSPVTLANVLTGPVISSLMDEIRAATAADAECCRMMREPATYGLTFRDGLLYQHPGVVYVPNDRVLRSKILEEVHTAPLGGHLGIEKTLVRLGRTFYWASVRRSLTS